MIDCMRKLLKDVNLNAPATQSEISEVEAALGLVLPAEYTDFLRRGNGGEGFIGNTYIMLWKCGDIKKWNADYQVEEWAPGLLLFGSNGGGEAFGFDTRGELWEIVAIPFVGMEWEYAWKCGETFTRFLALLQKGEIDV